MINVLTIILPVIVMLAIGSICRKFAVFSSEGIGAMKKLVVNITLSAVLINAFATMEYKPVTLLLAALMFGVCLVSWAVGTAYVKIRKRSIFIPYLLSGFEAGMLGYAFYTMLYGTEEISEFARLDLGQVLFVFTFYKVMLSMAQPPADGKKIDPIREMMTTPTVIAILAGVVLGVTGIHKIGAVGTVLDACTDFIGAPTSAVILFTIGYELVLDEIPWKKVGEALVLRIALMALIRILLGFAFSGLGLGTGAVNALNVMVILPPPFVISVFSDDPEEQNYLSSSLTISTAVSIIGFMVLAVLGAM